MSIIHGNFPATRLRRNRKNQAIRDLLAKTNLNASDLILPLFVCEGQNQIQAVQGLDGVNRYSIDQLIKKVNHAQTLGIKAIMLFPVVDSQLKTADGLEALNSNNLICRAIKEIKKHQSSIQIFADVALDPYTSHGHDGVIDDHHQVINDQTVEILGKQALVLAQAGVDVVAPSDMMDGRIKHIREILDCNNFQAVSICGYSVKYASNFYRPFRLAVGSSQNLKNPDKKNYQMDFRNSNEALLEIAMDIAEGVDMAIIKPAISYLDIIYQASQQFHIPIITYQVSAEYQSLKLLSNNNQLEFNLMCYEQMIAMKRAGVNAIISYASVEIAEFLSNF
jgi:porphobilinogen synthase